MTYLTSCFGLAYLTSLLDLTYLTYLLDLTSLTHLLDFHIHFSYPDLLKPVFDISHALHLTRVRLRVFVRDFT